MVWINSTRPVGEIFEYKGKKLEVICHRGCDGCYARYGDPSCRDLKEVSGRCSSMRSDKKSVIFASVKKKERKSK